MSNTGIDIFTVAQIVINIFVYTLLVRVRELEERRDKHDRHLAELYQHIAELERKTMHLK